jgi:hypothetical protein
MRPEGADPALFVPSCFPWSKPCCAFPFHRLRRRQARPDRYWPMPVFAQVSRYMRQPGPGWLPSWLPSASHGRHSPGLPGRSRGMSLEPDE